MMDRSSSSFHCPRAVPHRPAYPSTTQTSDPIANSYSVLNLTHWAETYAPPQNGNRHAELFKDALALHMLPPQTSINVWDFKNGGETLHSRWRSPIQFAGG